MELLRIVAMLMVVAVHASTKGFGWIAVWKMHHYPVKWTFVALSTMMCIACVNVFVLITGWFGTHFKWRGVGRLVGQTVTVSLSMYAVVWLLGAEMPHSLGKAVKVMWGYWFVRSYLLLYMLSPVLNSFVEHSTERQLGGFLLTYYAFFIPMAYIDDNIGIGYNTMSFIGLYLLARYLRLYGADRLRCVPTWAFWAGWGAMVVAGTLIMTLSAQFASRPYTEVSAYSCVVVIAEAVLLLLAFSRIKIRGEKLGRCINWVAAGSFTVYLTHEQLFLRKPFYQGIKHIISHVPNPVLCSLAVLGAILAIFAASVCLDWLRRLLVKRVEGAIAHWRN